ncbi:hypothetical protein QBC43DRAFT_362044 [Cladorrhinum sp. PSN259]|nr:hypothetical protein QBC43DRAFT_362044 [Cladorrhinum sp. PSN259]
MALILPDQRSTGDDLAESLWNLAYDQPAMEKPDLQLVQRALEKAQKTTSIQDGVGNAVQVTLALKGVIDSALHSAPQAALAWAGISVLLQLLVNSRQESESNREGTIYIARRMDWKRRIGFVRDLFRLDNWEGTLEQMEDRFRQDSNEFTNQRSVNLLKRLVDNTHITPETAESPSAVTVSPLTPQPKLGHRLPFGRNNGFLGRVDIMTDLIDKIPPDANPDNCHRIAIEGLGGSTRPK